MAHCAICNGKFGVFGKVKTSDGIICGRCASICASSATLPTATIKGFWLTNQTRWDTFTPTMVLKSFMSDIITIDDTHRYFIFGDVKKLKFTPVVFSFDEVKSYDFETVGQTVVTKKKGGITRAVIGGMVAGPVGALVGSGTAKAESKKTGGVTLTKVHFVTHTGNLYHASSNYPTGFVAFLDSCIGESQAAQNQPVLVSSGSSADEILKYKELRDEGIITEEEFQAKKTQLLGV